MSVTSIHPATYDTGIRWSHRDIPLAHSYHLCGRVAFTPPAQSVPVESDLEAEVVHWLSQHPGLLALHAQPFTLSYRDGTHRRRYTPDLLAVFAPVPRRLRALGFGPWTVVEVKSALRLADEYAQVHARLQIVAATLGFAAVCVTGDHLVSTRRH